MSSQRRKKYRIRLPTWKAYLYSFIKRFKIYKRINQGNFTDLFKLGRGEILVIKNTLFKFGNGGVWERENKFNILNFYLNFVEQNQKRVSVKDLRIAYKISPLRKIKGETLMSELLTLKKFAKEVGLGFSDIKGLDEEELVIKICENIEEKGNYSKEFVKWYADVEKKYPSLFAQDNKEEVDIDQLIDAIESADNKEELEELFEMAVFEEHKKKLSKIKKLEDLQEAMLNVLSESSTADSKEKKSSIDSDVIEAIKEATDVEELKEFCQSDDYKDYFKDISLRGKQKVENLKAKMLSALGIKEESNEEINLEELESELNDLSDKDLKSKAEEYDIKPPTLLTKKKKEELIQAILEKASEGSNNNKESEITPSMIKEAVKSKDLETLLAACEAVGYKPKILEKKDAKKLGEKIMEIITSDEIKDSEEKSSKPKGKSVSIYSTIEGMVKEGKKSFAIIKEVTPLFEALGQDDKDFIKEKVKAMIEIVEMEA